MGVILRIEIINVEHKEFEEITTNHKTFNLYRRLGPEQWEHYLGPNNGWHEYRFTDVIYGLPKLKYMDDEFDEETMVLAGHMRQEGGPMP